MRGRWAWLLVPALLLGACGDDDSDTPPTTVTEDATTTVEDSTTTAPTSALPTDPESYAVALVEAWEHGDSEAAEQLATAEAVETLFAFESGGPGSWSLVMCEGAAGSTYCTFNAGGDPTVIVRVANGAASMGQSQAVTEATVEA